jgi:hypothetical protein
MTTWTVHGNKSPVTISADRLGTGVGIYDYLQSSEKIFFDIRELVFTELLPPHSDSYETTYYGLVEISGGNVLSIGDPDTGYRSFGTVFDIGEDFDEVSFSFYSSIPKIVIHLTVSVFHEIVTKRNGSDFSLSIGGVFKNIFSRDIDKNFQEWHEKGYRKQFVIFPDDLNMFDQTEVRSWDLPRDFIARASKVVLVHEKVFAPHRSERRDQYVRQTDLEKEFSESRPANHEDLHDLLEQMRKTQSMHTSLLWVVTIVGTLLLAKIIFGLDF